MSKNNTSGKIKFIIMHLGTWLKCMKYIDVSLNGIIEVSGHLNSWDYVTCEGTEEMLKNTHLSPMRNSTPCWE